MQAGPGRPKGSRNNPFKQALNAQLKGEGNYKKLLKIADVLIAKALDGEIAAIKEIADRTDGKPAQAVTGPNGGPVQMAVFDPTKLQDLSDEELSALERATETVGIAISNPSGEAEAD